MKYYLYILLRPLSWIYGFVMYCRNWLYNHHILCTTQFHTPVVGIGNLTVGGTGKTPFVELLIELYAKHRPITVISRGYKRKTRGIRIANQHDTALTIGDEPYCLYKKYAFSHDIQVMVAANRAKAIAKCSNRLVLLDDAMQHRKVTPTLQIVLTTYCRPFFDDALLPYGRLREVQKNIQRAAIVIVTKCPDNIHQATQEAYRRRINKLYIYDKPAIFFTRIVYLKPVPIWVNNIGAYTNNIILVTGIAQPKPLVDYLQKKGAILYHLAYPDHHVFTIKDVQKIKKVFDKIAGNNKCMLTTEKDSVRLLYNPFFQTILQNIPCYYLPIKMKIIDQASMFEQQMLNRVIFPFCHFMYF